MRNTCIYGLAGTITFRRNSSGYTTNFVTKEGNGTNLQNIEKSARAMYIPDEGKIFVQVDQSGAEAKIVAYLSRDGKFRSLFLNNVKPHVFVALHLFTDIWQKKVNEFNKDVLVDVEALTHTEIPELQKQACWKEVDTLIKSSDNWSDQERYYYIAKQVCHSHNYDIRPAAFQLNTLEKSKGKIVLTKKQAEDYGMFYRSLFPEITEWHREVQKQIEQTRTLYNLFGFPRYFSGIINEAMLKEAYAFVPQSTVGCITAIAYTKLQQFIEEHKLDWDLLADTHDSYLVQCPIKEEVDCARVMKGFMEQELVAPNGTKFRMKSEVASGYNWAPYKKDKNPDGLKEIKI